MTKNIAVVGGEGYIGSVLIREIAAAFPKANIHSYDFGWFSPEDKPVMAELSNRFIYFDQTMIQNGDIDKGYIFFDRGVAAVISDFDVIIWVAGHSSVAMCTMDPVSAHKNNIDYFRSYLKYYQELPSKPLLIVASSSSVYGKSLLNNCREEDILPGPCPTYDRTMLERENMFPGNIPAIILRLGTVCGAGINHRSELMLNSMVKSAIETQTIYYSNPDTNRAILYNMDLADIVVKLIQRNEEQKYQQLHIFNAGSFNSTVGDLSKRTMNYLNISKGIPCIQERYAAPESNYSFRLYLDKIQTHLGLAIRDRSFYRCIDDLVELYTNPKPDVIIGTRNESRKYE